MGAGFYLKIFLFAGIFDLYIAFMRNILKSAGRTKAISNLEIIKSIIRITCIVVSLFLGMKMLIYGILLASIINAILSAFFARSNICYSIRDQIIDLSIPVIFSLGIMLITFAIYRLFLYQNIWSIFFIIIGYVLYFAILILIKNEDVLEMKNLAMKKIKSFGQKQ